MENNQQWSQARPEKFIARLLVDVETQITPHLKTEEGLNPTKKKKGREIKIAKCGEKDLTKENTNNGHRSIFNTVFHQQKLSSLSIARNVKPEGALYSVFCAEASERPRTFLNE